MGMHDLSLTSKKPYRKSAKVTGDVTGNYHPHGTASVYDTIVRWRRTSPCAMCWWMDKVTLVPLTAILRRLNVIPKCACHPCRRAVARHRQKYRRFCSQLDNTARNPWCFLARFLTFSSMVPRVSPWVWHQCSASQLRRGHRCFAPVDRSSRIHRERPDEVYSRSGFSNRWLYFGP